MSEIKTPEAEYLYHYTDPRGLLGIGTSKSLWASNIRYLSDSTEYLHAVRVALSIVQNMENVTQQEREFFDYLLGHSQVGAWIRSRQFGAQYYVVSLTKRPDLLSQWRTYAPKSGYCIGWRVDVLERAAKLNDFALMTCLYKPEEQRVMVKPVVEGALQRWRENPCALNFSGPFWAPREETAITAYTQLIKHTYDFDAHFGQVATVCKHESFEEEAEWRLVCHDSPIKRIQPVRFREGRSVLIPFVEFSLEFESMGIGQVEAQTRIICGPSPESDLAQNSAMNLFATNAWYGGTWSSQSQVPYRDW